jgi:hypothetical protein
MSRPCTPLLASELLSDAGARLSRSLPPCGGGLGREVAPSSVFVAYPSPERFAFDLPRKGGGDKRGR